MLGNASITVAVWFIALVGLAAAAAFGVIWVKFGRSGAMQIHVQPPDQAPAE